MNRVVHIANWRMGAYLITACAGMGCAPAVPVPTPTPSPAVETPPVVAPTPRLRVRLPLAQPASRWAISSVTQFTDTDTKVPAARPSSERITTSAVVSLEFNRGVTGALRGAGQIDSFTIRSSNAGNTPPLMVLIDAIMDSSTLRVVSHPPLVNECDRPEASAMQLARELLVRIPDGVSVGDAWQDSTVSLVCRSGIPLTVTSVTRSTLREMTRERLVVTRELRTTIDGKGGTAFRAFAITGSGSGSQRLELSATSGVVDRLQGSSTLTLQLSERIPPGAPTLQRLRQQVELRAERRR